MSEHSPPLTDKMEIVYSHDGEGADMILSGLSANESHVRAYVQDWQYVFIYTDAGNKIQS